MVANNPCDDLKNLRNPINQTPPALRNDHCVVNFDVEKLTVDKSYGGALQSSRVVRVNQREFVSSIITMNKSFNLQRIANLLHNQSKGEI